MIRYHPIRHDKTILTCTQKLIGNQLSVPHVAKKKPGKLGKLKTKTSNRRTGSNSVHDKRQSGGYVNTNIKQSKLYRSQITTVDIVLIYLVYC